MTIPHKYQEEGVRRIHKFGGRALLADEMGLGKTFQTLLYAKRYVDGPVVVVCPASIKWNWQREAAKHIGTRAEVLEGMKPPSSRLLIHPDTGVFIINYDILGPWLKFLTGLKPGLVIIDECQAIKGRNTKRTKNVKALCRSVEKVICVSGTPITNRPAELWPSLNILKPEKYKDFFSFGMKFCKARRTFWGWEFKGASNLALLHSQLKADCMIRRKKQDVLADLPGKTRSVLPIELPDIKHYNEALTDFVGWMRKHHKDKAASALRAEQITKIGYLKRLVGILKLPVVEEWIDNFLEENSGKLIVFGVHKKVLKYLHSVYGSCSVLVDGSVTGHNRQLMIDKFSKNKQTRLFFGNIQAAGSGWNGTVANTTLFAELDWTPGSHNQAEDRIHRIGQTRGASCYYLVAKNTIEEPLCKIIQEKQETLDATLDGTAAEDGTNIFDLLTEILMKDGKHGIRQPAARSRN